MPPAEPGPEPRFLPLADVAAILNISMPQAYSLVHSGDLKAMQVGRRFQWRVERSELEAYIQRCYRETRERLATMPAAIEELDAAED